MLTDPAQLLADLVDLRGSVVLAQYISGEQDGPSPQPSHPQSILALVAKTVEDVRSRLEFARENAFRPRFRLPTSQRAWSVLQRTQVTSSDSSKNAKERKAALKSATRIVWSPYAEFLEVQLKRSRFALKELREELSGPLAGLGPEVAAIERMDFALRQAIDAEVTRLYQRIGTYCEQEFSDAFKKALADLPVTAPQKAFSMGFSQEGWLGTIFRQGLQLVNAVVENEIQALENLIEQALAAYNATREPPLVIPPQSENS